MIMRMYMRKMYIKHDLSAFYCFHLIQHLTIIALLRRKINTWSKHCRSDPKATIFFSYSQKESERSKHKAHIKHFPPI